MQPDSQGDYVTFVGREGSFGMLVVKNDHNQIVYSPIQEIALFSIVFSCHNSPAIQKHHKSWTTNGPRSVAIPVQKWATETVGFTTQPWNLVGWDSLRGLGSRIFLET